MEPQKGKNPKRGKYKSLTLEQKIKVLIEVEKGEKKKSEIAKEYGILPNTLSTYIHNKEKILDSWKMRDSGTRKRLREGDHPLVDECVRQWLKEVYDQNIILNGTVIRTKAEEFGKQMGLSDFKASSGWLAGFKERNGISFKKIRGKKPSVDETELKEWTSNIPSLLKGYEPKNIFVADETGLFYDCLPVKTCFYKGEKCNDGKMSDERLTLLLGANMDGSEKLPTVVIGNTNSLKTHVKSLPVKYEMHENSWITADIFLHWLEKLDSCMIDQKRKIILFLCVRSAHAHIPCLTAVKLMFFPHNLSSSVKPMSAGVFSSFKQHYRQLIIRMILDDISNGVRTKIKLLDGIRMVSKAWKQVKKETIAECFQKSRFRISWETELDNSDTFDEDPLAMDAQTWQNSHYLSRRLVQYCPLVAVEEPEEWAELAAKSLAYSSYQSFVNVDENVAVCEEVTLTIDNETESIVGNEDSTKNVDAIPTPSEVKSMLGMLRAFVEAQENVTHETFDALDHLDDFIHVVNVLNKKIHKQNCTFAI